MISSFFESLPVGANGAAFLLMAALVWWAGERLAGIAEAIAYRTGIDQALVGLLLLAMATSLPEVGTTVGAALAANAPLVLNNLFGGIVMQTAVLAVADLTLRRGALSFFSPNPTLLLQGSLLVVLLSLGVTTASIGELWTIGHVGLWPICLAAAFVFSIYLLHSYEEGGRWQPIDVPQHEPVSEKAREKGWRKRSVGKLVFAFAVGSAIIFAAGTVLAQVADVLAVQTGLGSTFVGATLLAASTSLPEVSTTIGAVRLRAFSMAFSNIFGSNAVMVALIVIADAFYSPGPILDEAGPTSVLLLSMGIFVTAVYLVGLIERKDRSVLRLGFDSWAVAIAYAITLGLVYVLR